MGEEDGAVGSHVEQALHHDVLAFDAAAGLLVGERHGGVPLDAQPRRAVDEREGQRLAVAKEAAFFDARLELKLFACKGGRVRGHLRDAFVAFGRGAREGERAAGGDEEDDDEEPGAAVHGEPASLVADKPRGRDVSEKVPDWLKDPPAHAAPMRLALFVPLLLLSLTFTPPAAGAAPCTSYSTAGSTGGVYQPGRGSRSGFEQVTTTRLVSTGDVAWLELTPEGALVGAGLAVGPAVIDFDATPTGELRCIVYTNADVEISTILIAHA